MKIQMTIREWLYIVAIFSLLIGWRCHVAKLQGIVSSNQMRHQQILSRLEAIRTKGHTLSDSEVIDLIAAITDPSVTVASRADLLLRKVSNRQFGDIGNATQKQRVKIAASWIGWYLEERGDGVLHSVDQYDSRIQVRLRDTAETWGDLLNEADAVDWDLTGKGVGRR